MAAPLLALRGVHVTLGGTPVLRGVDLAVHPGELVGILGPNGSGKTTILRSALGFVTPATGEVQLLGRPPGALARRERARHVAFVAQRDELAFPYTVEEVVLMGRAPHASGLGFESERDRAVVAGVLAELDLTTLRDRPFPTLSGGERQRAVVARALAQDPRLVLLDEPTSALDIRHQVHLMERLAARNLTDGLTVVAVLHDPNLAALYCTRVVFLREGRVIADGPTADVMTYANVKAAFETEVYVGLNELNGKVYMVPMRPPQSGPRACTPLGPVL